MQLYLIELCSLEEQKPQRGLKLVTTNNCILCISLEEQKPQRGLKRTARIVSASTIRSLEEQKPQRGLKLYHYLHKTLPTEFGRAETPKGIETNVRNGLKLHYSFGRAETPKGIETSTSPYLLFLGIGLEEQKPQRGLIYCL